MSMAIGKCSHSNSLLPLAQAGVIVSMAVVSVAIVTYYCPSHKQEPLFKAAGLDDSKALYDAQQAIVSA